MESQAAVDVRSVESAADFEDNARADVRRPANVNLTVEGTADWAHWGLVTNSSFDHKSGTAQQISDFTVLGTNDVQQYSDSLTAYSWSDGTPTPSVADSTTGVFITGTT